MGFNNIFQNLDLLSVGVAIAAIGILGFTIFINNRKSITAISFLFFSVITIFWSIANYASYQIYREGIALWILRGVMFFAVWHALSFFQLAFVFPSDKIKFPKYYKFGIVPAAVIVSLLTLTRFVFDSVGEIDASGKIISIDNGPGIALFGLFVSFLIIGGIAKIFIKGSRAEGAEHQQIRFMLWGVFLTFTLLITFNFLLPAFTANTNFIPYGPIFLLPFALFTFYAIARHHLLNTKIISTEIVAFFLVVVSFSEIIFSTNFTEIVLRFIVFLALLLASLLLIQTVAQEVSAKEKIENLANSLETANIELKKLDRAKSEFISIASHQLRTPLTIIKGYISMIREGSYGKITQDISTAMNKIYISNERLIQLVNDLLDLSRMESGKMKYEFTEMDLGEVADSAVDEFQLPAKDKNLKIIWEKSNVVLPKIWGDSSKLRQVIFNLIDNALKYTNEGSIEIILEKENDSIKISVKDRGIGMSEETIRSIFQKFARGRESAVAKVNAVGVGLGLYIAKRIVDDHGGQIWVTSEGEGKGSTFSVRLPLASARDKNPKLKEFTTNE